MSQREYWELQAWVRGGSDKDGSNEENKLCGMKLSVLGWPWKGVYKPTGRRHSSDSTRSGCDQDTRCSSCSNRSGYCLYVCVWSYPEIRWKPCNTMLWMFLMHITAAVVREVGQRGRMCWSPGREERWQVGGGQGRANRRVPTEPQRLGGPLHCPPNKSACSSRKKP